jgi:hypothetical protein
MSNIWDKLTYWRATCDFPKDGVDYVLYIDPIVFSRAGTCSKVEFINIRGHMGLGVQFHFGALFCFILTPTAPLECGVITTQLHDQCQLGEDS